METVGGQHELDGGAVPDVDAVARRGLTILCIVYLILGLTHSVHFIAGDLALLREQAAAAAATLAELQNRQPPTGPELLAATASAAREASRAVWRGWGRVAGFAAGMAIVGVFLITSGRRRLGRQGVVSAATMMVVLLGGVLLASRLVALKALPELAIWGLADLAVLYLVACCLLPWTARESAQPFGLLLLVWALIFLFPEPDGSLERLDRLVVVLISPAALAPGALIATWRVRRLQERAERVRLGEQVRNIGGELSRARIVHDAMFPRPYDSGHLRFEYDYRPIAEIGGDYVHFSVCRSSGRVYLTLLDVAGHGLAAALTVNRLFGELERIRAEDPDAPPGRVMELLNRYIHLTMSTHSLYATGTCIMLDPSTGHVAWVNAGHPPALIRKAEGRILDLPGTTMLLGALGSGEFEANQQRTTIEPGDVIIAYTDGAFEARNTDGCRFGIDALRRTACFNPPPRDWSKFIGNAVASHHGGNAEDDVLVASLHLRRLLIGELVGEEVGEAVSCEL